MTSPGRWQLTKALSALDNGEVIAYPTEGVWGLGCDPFNADAVNRLLAIKNRSMDKGLILVAANLDQISPLLHSLSDEQRSRLNQSVSENSSSRLSLHPALHPASRPTTWLIPSHDLIPSWITGAHSTVAVRITKHPTVAALCQAYGGMIVSTSANPSKQRPALTQLTARHYFSKQINVYLSGKVNCAGEASEIRDLVTGDVLR